MNPPATHRPLGKTGLAVPPVVFGTSCLGNLYEVVPDETKLAIVSEIFRHCPAPVMLDSAGKYGAGLALEVIGDSLRKLGIPKSQVVISNKLGWYRVPLRGPEPTFERGVWAGIGHDAESRISYEAFSNAMSRATPCSARAARLKSSPSTILMNFSPPQKHRKSAAAVSMMSSARIARCSS